MRKRDRVMLSRWGNYEVHGGLSPKHPEDENSDFDKQCTILNSSCCPDRGFYYLSKVGTSADFRHEVTQLKHHLILEMDASCKKTI